MQPDNAKAPGTFDTGETVENILAASGIHYIPPAQVTSDLKRVYVARHAGSNAAVMSHDLDELLAWLKDGLTEATLARYEVSISYLPEADYDASPDAIKNLSTGG